MKASVLEPRGPIENISDTALWVAAYRAMESSRPDAHFHDHLAARLTGERGWEILKKIPGGKSHAWALVVRTCVLDEWILEAVREHSVDLVLNLAAGLDTRPYRLNLPSHLRWIEVDLPGILNYKEEKLAGETSQCRLERVRLDLSDLARRGEFFDRIQSEAKRVLVITEGLLIYLEESTVGQLARDLKARSHFKWWMQDFASPLTLAYAKRKWGKELKAGNSEMKFAPESGPGFFLPFGWKLRDVRYTMEEARRLKREVRGAFFYRLLAKFADRERQEKLRQMSGYAWLENQ